MLKVVMFSTRIKLDSTANLSQRYIFCIVFSFYVLLPNLKPDKVEKKHIPSTRTMPMTELHHLNV